MPSQNNWPYNRAYHGYNMNPQAPNYQNNRGTNMFGRESMRSNNWQTGYHQQRFNGWHNPMSGMRQNQGWQNQNMQNRMWPNQMQQNQIRQNQNIQNRMWPNQMQQNQMQQNQMQQNQMQQNQMQQNQMQQNQMQQNAAKGNPFNQPLPDGVTIQPLNEETLRQIQLGTLANQPVPGTNTMGGEQAETQTALNAKLDTSTPILEPKSTLEPRLRLFAQNERNGALFYKHLAGIAPYQRYRDILDGISDRCVKRRELYQHMHQALHGNDFAPEETTVNTRVGFPDGVRLAIQEESGMLMDLSDFYEESQDAQTTKKITAQIARKISDLSLLHIMLNA